MNIGSSARMVGRPCWVALLALVAAGPLGAQQYRPTPKFAGTTIPDPPSQGRPWDAPATTLPRFLTAAAGLLFDQGVADPRGCEYRQVEVGAGWTIVKGRGFVLPERADAPGRFVVCWDGLVYPALRVGEPTDLDRDIRDLAAHLERMRGSRTSRHHFSGGSWGFPGEGTDYHNLAGVADHSPIKLCLLLRLGRADLAEALFAAGTAWTPGPRARDLTDYRISYLSLAVDWAGSAFERLIGAHRRGDDAVALDAARRLAKFRDLVSAQADAMDFSRRTRQDRAGGAPAPRSLFFGQFDDLLRDQERRAQEPPRGPIPRKRGDPTARIAALIRDLDEIDNEHIQSRDQPFSRDSPVVEDLIAEGDPAVGPLLEVLESDNRLTRAVFSDRGGRPFMHSVVPVYQVAFTALVGLLKTSGLELSSLYGVKPGDQAERRVLADSMRSFWRETRSIPLAERWYRTLLDDSAGSARWLESAGSIVAPDVEDEMPPPRPGTRPFRGEALRAGRDPSVADLMIRRAGQIERAGDDQLSHDPGFAAACQMGTILAAWDDRASLPLLRSLSRECRRRSDRWRDLPGPVNADPNLASSLARFTEIRARLGDPGAIDEYAAWLRTTSPKMLDYGGSAALRPLLTRPDHPALASAARWLFNDPKSPWLPLLPEAGGEESRAFGTLVPSPLIVVADFRERVLIELADKGPIGTITHEEAGSIRREVKGLPTLTYTPTAPDQAKLPVGVKQTLRHCDALAGHLSWLEGSPRRDPAWPESRRDEAVAATAAHLKRYGPRYSVEFPPGAQDFTEPVTRLKFPDLGRPATGEDVADARAIFTLEGQGESRLASLPGFPRKARWVTLRDTPVDGKDQHGVITRRYDTDGFVWQAEEVRRGDAWERSYGFVGHHVIARAPATEIEFVDEFGPWSNLEGGLDARLELVEPRPKGFEPARPIPLALHIRNRLGVARSSPTHFLRPGPDGKPALRRGVYLSLWYSGDGGARSFPNQVYPNDPVEPSRDPHFDSGEGERRLDPLEAFEALRFDPHDWFDLTKPGSYRLRVAFAAHSGIGKGEARDLSFQVRGDE